MIELRNVQRWQTSISDAESLKWISLLDDGELLLSLEEPANLDVYRYRFKIEGNVAYRFILAEYLHSELVWCLLWETAKKYGRTIIIRESSWVKQIYDTSDFSTERIPPLEHYCIILEEGLFEVVAKKEPSHYNF